MSAQITVPEALRVAWEEGKWRSSRAESEELRAAAVPLLQTMVNEFLEGRVDLGTFASRSHKIAFDRPHWGFKAFGQMMINQYAKIATTSGSEEATAEGLRQALRVPDDAGQVRDRLTGLVELTTHLGEDAAAAGLGKPAPGRVPYVATYFWDTQEPHRWPVYYVRSREALRTLGLFRESGDVVEDYLRYQDLVRSLARALGGDVWDVDEVLYMLSESPPTPAKPPVPDPPVPLPSASGIDAYAIYHDARLVFPDEIVTSFLLSLWTKPFVILSGISGTGKTQIALRLAAALDGHIDGETTAIPEDADVIPLRVNPRLRDGLSTFTIGAAHAHLFDHVPDPSTRVVVAGPDGVELPFALDRRPNRFLLRPRGHTREWIREHRQVGQHLYLVVTDGEKGLTASLNPPTVAMAEEHASAAARYALIPVKPDWTDTRGLLGYWNPLTDTYQTTPFLDLLLRAEADQDRPYFAILDEMNLARVEYYFADLLSAMESREPIPLHAGDEDAEVPPNVNVPPNLFVIGTVNVDETTHAFSPKVLDRASVLEFEDVDVDAFLAGGLANASRGSVFRLANPTIDVSRFHVSSAADPTELADAYPDYAQDVVALHALLAKHHLHFGYRVLGEISTFVSLASRLVGSDQETRRMALDLAIAQKVLPKLNGGRELEEPLGRLLDFLLDPDPAGGDRWRDAATRYVAEMEKPPPERQVMFPRSAAKVDRMLRRLAATGFVSFLE